MPHLHPSFRNFFPHPCHLPWLPADKSIPGNEKIDKKAKSVMSFHRLNPLLLPTKTDFTFFIRKYITSHWFSLWRHQSLKNSVAWIKSTPYHGPHLRCHEIIITRFLIGQYTLPYPILHLLSLVPSFFRVTPLCRSYVHLSIPRLAPTSLRASHNIPSP